MKPGNASCTARDDPEAVRAVWIETVHDGEGGSRALGQGARNRKDIRALGHGSLQSARVSGQSGDYVSGLWASMATLGRCLSAGCDFAAIVGVMPDIRPEPVVAEHD